MPGVRNRPISRRKEDRLRGLKRLVKTRVIQVDPDNPSAPALAEAAAVLARGGLVAFATETVYGLGAVATDPSAVARIFAAKGRPSFNPLIVHVEGIARARMATSTWPESAERLAGRFWPGPLTLVLPRSPLIPQVVTGGRETVALRVPLPAVARGLIERGGPTPCGPQRQSLEPAFPDPGRARPHPTWTAGST